MITRDANLDNIFNIALDEASKDQREIHAVEILRNYLLHRPDHGRAWFCYGESLCSVERYEEAMNAFFRCLELTPEEKVPIVYGRIGFLCSLSRSILEAESWYRLGTSHKSCSDGWIWLFRGVNLRKLGRYEEALFCIRTSKNFCDVDDSEVALNIGLILRAMGKYEEAKIAFQDALSKDNNYQEAIKCLKGLEGLPKTMEISDELDTA